MLIDDYTPMKRVGIEELEGLVRMFEQRMDQRALDRADATPEQRRDEGAWVALQMLLTGRYRYGADFIEVFDNTCRQTFG